MGIQAESAWWLLLLPLWAAAIWWMIRHTPRLTGIRKAGVIGTRAIIILLLIAVAAGLTPYRLQEQRNVVFVIDRSASMQGEEAQSEWLAEAWSGKLVEDVAGIVSTGSHAIVDRPLSEGYLSNETAYTFRSELSRSHTNLAHGLQLASAMLRESGGGRIVLLSDGEENAGDALRQARLLRDGGIPIDVVPLSLELARDASIEELHVPSVLKQGETYSFEIVLRSTAAGAAELRLYEDDQELAVTEVMLEKGDNRFSLRNVALEPGFHRFRAEVFLDGDGQPQNNAAHAFSRVSGPPKVLIVEGVQGSSANIEEALSASLIGYDTIQPEQLSVELASYAAYDSIVLHNVPATRIAELPMEWLARATGDYGVGLVMLGGEDSYGLGGYFQTPVERALPVYMDLQGRKQMPSLGLVLVIDRSGSMDDGKLELAKEAAMRTVELLRDVDTVGVVAFDSVPWWVVEPTPLSNREEVLQLIQSIQAEGGTEIYSALDEGYRGLLDMEAERKHMILLTDGQSSTSMNYGKITSAMTDNKMTLSTVAVGDGADTVLLKRLANDGKGRYYFTRDQSTLPAIFSRETVMMSRTYIVEGAFTPGISDAGVWGPLWNGGVPKVQAYVATTAKEMAEVALWSPEDDPLLARWTYGAGRSVAWTSDAEGKWAPGWVQWEQFPKVVTEWVKWTFPQFDSSPYRLYTTIDGGEGKLVVEETGGDSVSGNGLAAMIHGEDGDSSVRRLLPVAPGQYEAKLDAIEPGVYLTQIGTVTGEEPSIDGGMTAGYVVPYSPEYRIGGEDGSALLERLAQITGGRVLDIGAPEQSFQFQPIELRVPYPLFRELLMAALLLWLLDIALRRLSLPWGRLAALLRRSRHASGQAVPQERAIGRLRQRSQERSQFYGSSRSTPVQPDSDQRQTGSELSSSIRSKSEPSRMQDIQPGRHASNGSEPRPAAPSGGGGHPQGDDSAQVSSQSGTINRLLAAKNKNKL
ncbi:VWA domain-containing protein [Paenibacillus sp. PL2-23]|uniref:VWA domain-containing protein n=1 Tax=Paenibacillus sp. PL2-23 TaxID=2100729 RepID=UPI0030FB60BD